MSKVIVIEPTRREIDVSGASRFGRLCYLFGAEGGQKPSAFQDAYVPRALERLDEVGFNPSSDSLLAAGTVPSILRLYAAMQQRYGTIRVVFFDPYARDYKQMEVGCAPMRSNAV